MKDKKEPIIQIQPSEQIQHEFIGSLDEPIITTIKRDLLKIINKIECVLLSKSNENSKKYLKDWDLWGPLLICVVLSIILGIGHEADTDFIFVIIFFVVWIGGLIVTINAQFLGTKVYFFQSICLLGYCVFPYIIFGLIIKLTPFFHIIVHFIFSLFALTWACYSSLAFMSGLVSPNKKLLVNYPVFLFYTFLSWIILTN